MGRLILPWNRQPPPGGAVVAPEYARGLVCFADGGVAMPRFLTAAVGTAFTGTRSVGGSGNGWLGSASAYVEKQNITAATAAHVFEIAANGDWTAQFVVDGVGGSGTNPGFFRGGAAGTGTTFLIQDGTTRRAWVRVNSVDILRPGSGAQWVTGQKLNLIVRFKNAARVDAWWDGKQRHAATHTTAQEAMTVAAGNAPGALLTHQQGGSGAQTTTGVMVACRVWSRWLDDGQVEALAANENALFEPRRIWVPVSAGGGAADLTIAQADHAHTAENLALTTESTLAIADATHGHAADALALTTASALTIADATHGHAADNLGLTSASALTVADALHAHTADNITLDTSAALTVADAAHAHSADSIALSSQAVLALADALHAHAADSIALTSLYYLATQDALHAHLADNIGLSLPGGPLVATPGFELVAARRRLEIAAARRRMEISR